MVIEPEFILPKPEEVSRGDIFIGWVRKHGRNLYPVRLKFEDLASHVSIFGMTGSGKSTTAALILSRLADLSIPVLVLDWHCEYRSLVLKKGGLVFTPGRDIAPLTINPLDPSLSEDISEHVALVTDIFADVFNFTPSQSWMFTECLYECLERCSEPPVLSTLVKTIEEKPIRSAYDNETKLALLRRLKPLTEGQAGAALNGQSTISIKDIISHTVCIELGHFKEQEVRKIFVSIFAKLLYDFRMKMREKAPPHVTIIEEARNIVPYRRSDMPPLICERLVAELRKFGESIIIVSQFPTQTSQEILKNSATRIIHCLKDEEDRRLIQGALNLTDEQAEFLHYLPPGTAIMMVPSCPHPFLTYIEYGPQICEYVPDSRLKEEMKRRFYDSFILIEEKEVDPFTMIKIQAKLYQLIKKRRRVNLSLIKEDLKEEFFEDVLKALEDMVRRGIVKEVIDAETGEKFYELGFFDFCFKGS